MRDDRQPAFVRGPRPFVSQHDEADFELVAGDADERRFAGPCPIPQRGGYSHVPQLAESTLVEQGINSISLNPDTVLKTTVAILEKEKSLG